MNISKPIANAKYYGWLICGLAALFYCYEYLLRIEPSVMVHELMGHFQVTAAGISLITAMYYYAYTPLQAGVGVITDAWGSRRVLIGAVLLCAFGCLGFYISQNVFLASLSRFLIGAGSAFAFVGVLKLAAVWLPRSRFAFFVGLTTSLGMAGAMVGDVGMAWVVQSFGWQKVIFISAVFGFFLAFIFFLFVRETPQTTSHTRLEMRDLFKELFKILRNRQIIYAGVIGCLLYLSLSVFGEMWGIPFIHNITGKSNVVAAEINSMVFLGWLLGSPMSGWLSDRLNSRKLPLIFGGIIAAASISLIILWPTMNIGLLSLLLFLFGFASSAEIICFAIGRDNVSLQYTATAMATINLLVMLGGMLLQPLVGSLLDLFWSGQVLNGVRVYDAHAYQTAMIIIPMLMLVASVLSFLLKDNYQTQEISVKRNQDITKRRIHWKCRRGMLELDLLLEKFYGGRFASLSVSQQQLFDKLLDLPDPILYGWLMGHEKPTDDQFIDLVGVIRKG